MGVRGLKKKKAVSKKSINFKRLGIFASTLLLLVYVVYTFVSQQISLAQREEIASKYREEISNAKLEQEQLKKELENSKSDEYLEKMAREKLGLVKANERVFVDVTRD